MRYEGSKIVPEPNKSYKTIAYIFGTNTSAIELFLIDRKIKGPCWINIENFRHVETPTTWCKLQVSCSNPLSVSIIENSNEPPPPLVLLSLNVRVAMQNQSKNEIVAVSCLSNRNFIVDKPTSSSQFNDNFCLVTHPSNRTFPMDFKHKIAQRKINKIQLCDSERALLNCFLGKVQQLDPDLIVTHDAYARQLDVLCNNLSSVKIPLSSRIGRLKLSNISSSRKVEDYFIGRMICDIKLSSEELIRLRNYDMHNLCKEILQIADEDRRDVYPDEIIKMFESSDALLDLIHLTMQDNVYTLRIMSELNILPLALQITNIAGNLMSGTLRGGRSERNEYLLLHAFAEKNYIVPDKQKKERKKNDGNTDTHPVAKKKGQYAGGLVLEPIKGFYDKYVLLLDFNSLYPSIIQEFNICFTTVSFDESGQVILPDSTAELGILPRQIRKLVDSRRQVKSLLAQPDLSEDMKTKYNIRQKALKLTANSMYGCLGFSHSRFFAQHLAALITQKGRDILTNTKSLVEKLQYVVVYGDTDSIMVLTNSVDYDKVLEIGMNIKQSVNKTYRHIELDIDGVFKYLLLLKKKKYAAITISKTSDGRLFEAKEYKGLDIVRRDWCKLAQIAGEHTLNEILSDIPMDERVTNIHNYLQTLRANLKSNKIDIPLLEITKQLSHAVGEYRDASSLPHVQVAMRMNITMNRHFKKNDVVGYVICNDGSEEAATKRAYHVDEIKLAKHLTIDIDYYLSNQVHPVVSRIIEPLDLTDKVRIAECLGLDPSKYRKNR